jgi:hypothetical protein
MGVLVGRLAFLELGGFDCSLSCGEDRDLWARIVSRFEIAAVHEPLLHKVERPHGLSHDIHKTLRDGLRVNRRLCVEMLQPHARTTRQWLKARLSLCSADAVLHFSIAWLYRENGEVASAFRFLMKSFILSPFEDPKRKCGLLLSLCGLTIRNTQIWMKERLALPR